jgi:GNAT superfamily N-acetyltransferase
MQALGAFDDDETLVGIVHVVFHRSTWLPDMTCYLQDLYVHESQRGRRVGEALIERVALLAREKNAGRLYWLTQEDNATARKLYDRVAVAPGFIQYRKPL